MIITIAGKGGSGKTTVAKEVAKRLGYKHISTGDLRGKIAMEHNMTIDELNKVGMTEDWTDKELDKKIEHVGKTQDNLVIDSWMAWHFIPNSVKIFLDIDDKESAKRVFANQRPDEPKQETVKGVLKMLTERWKNNIDRYKKWYGVDIYDLKNYDFVLDTTGLNIEQCAQKVLEFIHKKK